MNIILICILISSLQPVLLESRLLTLYHVTHHVTVITYLFIVHKQKQNRTNIKSRKIDKKKRKILVSKHTIILGLARTSKVE